MTRVQAIERISTAILLLSLAAVACGALQFKEQDRRLQERLKSTLDDPKADSRQLRELIQRGASVDARSKSGRTPLMAAAGAGDYKFCRQLLEHHADVDVKDRSGQTALLIATAHRHPSAAILLIEAGADVSIGDAWGDTPLMWACAYGDVPVVRALLSHGARKDRSNDSGTNARTLAAKAGNREVLQLLETAIQDSTPGP
jgi:ankyrin repeat protein